MRPSPPPFRIIRGNGNRILNSQPWNILSDKVRATNAPSWVEKLYKDPRFQIPSTCTLTRICIYRKVKAGSGRASLPLVTDGRGGSEEHIFLQAMLHLCPGNRSLSLVILSDLIFKARGLGLEQNTKQLVVVLVMLIKSCYFPYWIAFNSAFLFSSCLWHQTSSAVQGRMQEWNCYSLLSSAPWGPCGDGRGHPLWTFPPTGGTQAEGQGQNMQ